jgi:hypothetical protein
MTPTDLPRIRISDPEELIDLIPYLIGFHPRESLVLVGFGGGNSSESAGQVQVAVRVDLPADESRAEELQQVVGALVRSSVRSAVAVVMTNTHEGNPRASAVLQRHAAMIGGLLDAAGIALLDLLVADEVRWWSVACEDAECCPASGLPRSPGSSVVAAEATVAGLVAFADRSELEAQLAPEADRHRLEPALATAEHRVTRALLDNGLRRLRRTDSAALFAEIGRRSDDPSDKPKRLTNRRLARFGVALTDIEIRDELWLAIDDSTIDAESLVRELVTRLPEPYDAAPLFLFGWIQWRLGNGTLAGTAAERALESDPRYSAANLLLTAVRHGLDPRTTPSLREPAIA